jgi:hypothetical protein
MVSYTSLLPNPYIPPDKQATTPYKPYDVMSSFTTLFEIRCRQGLHNTRALTKSRPEDTIRVLEHTVLQTDDDELAALKPRFDETSDILRM